MPALGVSKDASASYQLAAAGLRNRAETVLVAADGDASRRSFIQVLAGQWDPGIRVKRHGDRRIVSMRCAAKRARTRRLELPFVD
jgi:hypothetical protein